MKESLEQATSLVLMALYTAFMLTFNVAINSEECLMD